MEESYRESRASFITAYKAKGAGTMLKFVIEREIPEVGKLSPE
jgi:hypothetical protein